MLTLFSVPKPFTGHVGVIQRNALESWTRLPGVEVLLLGDERGVGEAARELGFRHAPEIALNEYGTPLLDVVFREARARSSEPLLAYANADIVFLSDFVAAVRRVRLERFLLVGRRWTLDIDRRLDFERPGIEAELRRMVAQRGEPDPPSGVDYFVFQRAGPLGDLPPFAIGRPGWDNWMIYDARRRRVPVIDATRAVTAIHQRHGHDHVKAKRKEPWLGAESDANYALVGEIPHFQTLHATHVLGQHGLFPALWPPYLEWRFRTRHVVDGHVERLARVCEPAIVHTRELRNHLRRRRRPLRSLSRWLRGTLGGR